ncbi:MAG: hypothetical protein OXI01_17095 [Albidovulum sp.]|nr:hypothetical protein [Albidovulum sp.]
MSRRDLERLRLEPSARMPFHAAGERRMAKASPGLSKAAPRLTTARMPATVGTGMQVMSPTAFFLSIPPLRQAFRIRIVGRLPLSGISSA